MHSNQAPVPLMFEDLKVDRINFAGAPAGPNGELTIERLDAAQLSAKLGITAWTEAIVGNPMDSHLHQIGAPYQEITELEYNLMTSSVMACRAEMAICYLNETVGYGVKALNPIPKDTWITWYAGHLQFISDRLSAEQLSNMYGFGIFSGDKVIGSVNAEQYRNAAGCMLHLPRATSLERHIAVEDYLFTDPIKPEHIASANIAQLPICYKNIPIIAFKTIREIQRHELIGYSYGLMHWQNTGKVPYLFNTQGQMIDSNFYKTKNLQMIIFQEGGKGTFIEIKQPREVLDGLFEKGPLVFDTSNGFRMMITKEDYEKALANYPGSPFIIIPQPSLMASLESIKKQMAEQKPAG